MSCDPGTTQCIEDLVLPSQIKPPQINAAYAAPSHIMMLEQGKKTGFLDVNLLCL